MEENVKQTKKEVWIKRIKKTVWILGGLFLAGILLLVLLNLYMKISVLDDIFGLDETEEIEGADCILILGCGLWDGEPTPMLKDRLGTGIKLYEAGVAPKILVSGDHGRSEYNEVRAMKDYLIERGVPSEDIFMDHAGFSTYESMYRARDVFLCEKIVVVTQEYHLYRALYDAQALDIDALGVAAEQIHDPKLNPKYWLRETVARAKDIVYCIFEPLPTYLGDAVSISGDGDVTNDTADAV